jgi:ATP-binding cassette subfamily B protein
VLALLTAVIDVMAPRLLGRATDLLFAGAVSRHLPPGMTKEQAVAGAYARGDGMFAHMLVKMNLTPGSGIDFQTIGHILAAVVGLYVVSALLVSLQAQLLKVAIQRMMEPLRAEIEAKLHRLPLSYIDARQHGELLSRFTNDVDNIQTALKQTASALPTTLMTVGAVLATMVTISPLLAVIVMGTVPISVLANNAVLRRSRRLRSTRAAQVGRLNAQFEEVLSGLAVFKACGHPAHVRDQFARINSDVSRAGTRAQFTSGLIAPATTFVGNLGYIAVAVFGGLQVATGRVSLGGVQAFIQYVRQFNQPVTDFVTRYDLLQAGLASAERVFELLDAAEEEPGTGRVLSLCAGPGRVEFDRVTFGYQPGRPMIHDLSLVAEPGSTVAIVGPTGSGKSTLVNLLMRFYEVDSGRILIDGVDIATVDRKALRSRAAMVLQDTWLFAGTIADNIGYGRPGATREEILVAAEAAHVDQFVRALPDGYDTWVDEDGGNLSAGEKQLITIARALLARPQLLILDEATSSVDTRTEELIGQAMAVLRRGRTCFVIAHRLSTIRDADVIVVMQGGRVVERGSHQELMYRRGVYYRMTQADTVTSPAAGAVCEGMRRHSRARAGDPHHRLEPRSARGPAGRSNPPGAHVPQWAVTRPGSGPASPHSCTGDSAMGPT